MGQVITTLELQKRNKERVNVYLDDEYAFSLSLVEASKLRKGQTLSDEEIALLRNDDAVIRAVDSALRFLAYRPRSTQEVRRNLTQKELNPVVIDSALDKLSQMGYLNDADFARFWVDNRTQFKPLGPRALRYELRQKGVADDLIEHVLAETEDPQALAYRAAAERARRISRATPQDFRKKIGSFLQRRGFNYETTHTVIEQLVTELSEEGFFPQEEDE